MTPEQTEVTGPPGSWLYNNFHPLLLGLVLERATRTPIAEHAEEKLWKPLGAEAAASWSVDSQEHRFPKLESGFNARPRDYARLGRLMLQSGRGPRGQYLTRLDTGGDRAAPAAGHYGYMWWLHDGGGAFSARGKYGQIIAVVPDRDAVVVRSVPTTPASHGESSAWRSSGAFRAPTPSRLVRR